VDADAPHPPWVRPLGPEDHADLLRLWRESGLTTIRPEGRDAPEAFAGQIAGGLLFPLGLIQDGRLIGAVLATHDGRKGWINRLAIAPSFRRRGYARLLVASAEETLRRRGLQVMAALVESDNRASFELFRDLGYVEIDPGIHYLSKRDRENARAASRLAAGSVPR
jgi:N-acetylglutamate synthase